MKHNERSTITDSEIERERIEWVRKRQAAHLEFVKPLLFHTSSTFMDYLHGDVNDGEAESACEYEYTRESNAMWEAANERDELRRANPKIDIEEIALHIVSHYGQEPPINHTLMVELLACESFPKKDWNELSLAERNRIMGSPGGTKTPPLPIADVWSLKAFGFLDRLAEMAKEAESVVEDVPPGQYPRPLKRVPALLQQHESAPGYYAVFYLDFSKSETQLVNEFRARIKLRENQERLKQHQKPKSGATGKPLDRLKDLAAWRLYRELDNDWNAANDFANGRRKHFTAQEIRERYKTKEKREKYQHGDPKPFRDAKEQAGQPPNRAELFGDDAETRDAKASAWDFLAEMIPGEFHPPGPFMLRAFVELGKIALDS